MTNATTDHWGERRTAQRVRRRIRLRAATFTLALLFGFGGRYVVPVGAAANGLTLLWLVAFAAPVLAIGWLIWRDSDEIQRRKSTNALAAAGFVVLPMLPAARLAGRVLGIADPALAIAGIGVATIVVSYAVQRIRG